MRKLGKQESVFNAHCQPDSSLGAGALNYDFGALESADNKLTESYVNLRCGSLRHQQTCHDGPIFTASFHLESRLRDGYS